MALPQCGEANLVVVVRFWADLVLGDLGLDGLIVAQELCDPKCAGFIDCNGGR